MPGLCFIGLNILDAYLTGLVLGMGGIEFNPLMYAWGDNMLVKGLVAAVIAGALYLSRKERCLYYVNLLLLGVVLWNAACGLYGYLIIS